MRFIKHAHNLEMWITARSRVNNGWQPTPRHAHGGRHACESTRLGRKTLARVYG